MSGFFSRLAERALGGSPRVEPRVPSLFAALPTPADEDVAPPVAPGSTPSSTELPRDVQTHDARRVDATPTLTERSRIASRVAPLMSAYSPREIETAAPPLDRPTDAELSARIDHLITRLGLSSSGYEVPSAPRATAIREIVQVRESGREEPHEAVKAVRTIAPRELPQRHGERDDRSRVSPEVRPPAASPRRVSPAVHSLSIAPAAADQRPVVRISIGRLEVRTVSTPPAPAAPRPAAPRAMGLDEYLARRSGGPR
jgi:hypothetical protein